jgi:hypothetical protein
MLRLAHYAAEIAKERAQIADGRQRNNVGSCEDWTTWFAPARCFARASLMRRPGGSTGVSWKTEVLLDIFQLGV